MKFIYTSIAAACFILSAAANAQEAPPETGAPVSKPKPTASAERIVARVGDQVITEQEYQKSLGMRWISEAGPRARTSQPDAAFRAQVMREMVDARILRVLARNSGVEITDDAVLEEFNEGRDRMPSPEAFQEYMDKLGLTQDRLMSEIRDRMLVEEFTRQETKDVVVTDEETRDFYEKLKAAGKHKRTSPTADLLQILMISEGDSEMASEQAKARVEAARQRVLDGESFEDVARDVSQDVVSAKRGGLYREAVPGLVGPEVSQRMMEIPLNELSEPFKSNLGWHVIKVTARYEPGEMSYEHMAGVIGERLLAEKRKQRLAERINDARALIRVELTPSENN